MDIAVSLNGIASIRLISTWQCKVLETLTFVILVIVSDLDVPTATSLPLPPAAI